MKSFLQKVYSFVISLYILSVVVFVPYYNWNYAKTHGFVKWICLGEIVATAKSVAWPYYVFFSKPVNSPDANHFLNSKKAYDEALLIVDKVGDVSKLPSDSKSKFADLLRLAIVEANQVQSIYLNKAHPDYSNMYESKYKHGMRIMLQGIEINNTALILDGVYKCNDFADWIHAHKSEFTL